MGSGAASSAGTFDGLSVCSIMKGDTISSACQCQRENAGGTFAFPERLRAWGEMTLVDNDGSPKLAIFPPPSSGQAERHAEACWSFATNRLVKIDEFESKN